MIAFIWKLIIGGLWKPILAVLGAVGVYFKGRSDAAAKAKAKDAAQTIKQHEVRNEVDDDVRRGDARDRLREWRE